MSLYRNIYYSLSPAMRRVARRIYYYPSDFLDTVLHRRENMIPPKGLIFIGSGDFKGQGLHIQDMLVKHAGLKPDSRILDIGCGIGRLAVPLTAYLNEKGSYEGFDIVKKGIDWCNKHIAARFPNFKFIHVDLKNDLYNLNTETEARHFTFPYQANQFDCIVLTSVFTHMIPEDVDNYLGQISQVLKDNGKCLITFFLLNPEIHQRMNEDKTNIQFTHAYQGYSLLNKDVKEADIAYEEAFLSSMIEKNGLMIAEKHYGWWSDNDKGAHLDYQDVVILTKKG